MKYHLGDPQLHFWLTRSVARVMGVSFSEEMACSRLTAQEYSDLVTDCRGCPLVESCQEWLSSQNGLARSAPPGCRNKKALETLARPH